MKKTLRGSYTVEAAVILPLALFVTVIIIQLGIGLYCEINEEFQKKDSLCKTEPVKLMYRIETVEDVWEELEWN